MASRFSRSSALNVVFIVALLAALLPAAAPARAQAAAPEILFSLQTPAYRVEPTPAGLDRLVLEGFAGGGQPGQPILPYRVYNLALPPDVDPASLALELLDVQTETLPGAYKLEAARAPQIKSQPLPPGADQPRLADRPAAAGATLLPPGQLRRWQFARVRFDPAGYDPATGAVTLITAATLRLTYTPRVSPLAGEVLSDGVMDEEARALLDNFDQAQGWYPPAGQVSAAAVSNYVIITTNAIKNGSTRLADFVTFKQNQGYSVLVVTETDYNTVTGPAPNTRAEKIRTWLQNNYIAMGIRYVLLIGNPDPEDPTTTDSVGDLPMKMCYPTAEYDAPTDYYYADLTGNWNKDGDNRSCEYADLTVSGGVDLAAEVYVGRIPVYNNNLTNLDSILQKTIAYESDPDPAAWRKTALLPMSFVDSGTDDAHFAEQMKSEYLTGAGISTWTMYQQGSGPCGANSTFASSEELRGGNRVRDRWNASDYGLVIWSGHGSTSTVAVGYDNCWDNDLFNSPLASTLDNSRPSFVYASSCNNGYPEAADNLGFSLLLNGAIATLSASRVSWYIPGDYDFRADPSVSGMGFEYNRRLVVNNDTAGKALFDTKNATATDGDAWLMNKFDMNLYGDPSAALLTAPPPGNPSPNLSSMDPSRAPAGSPSLTLNLSGSNFMDGSIVRWNGQDLPTIFISATQLTASVASSLLANAGTAAVTVFNPQPGGGTSTSLYFLVDGSSGTCTAAAALQLDQPDVRRNDSPGSTDQIDTYPGVSWTESGPEFAYSFTAAVPGSYTAALSNLSTDLDIFLLDGSSGSCEAGRLLSYSDNQVTFNAAAGQQVYIVVDGYNGNVGSYTLTASCPSCPGPAVLTRLAPVGVIAGAPDLDMVVTGTHFVPESSVLWDGSPLDTTFTSSTSLTARVTADRLAAPHTASVTVSNPGEQVSNALEFFVQEDNSNTCTPMLHLTGPARDSRRSDSFGSTDLINSYPTSGWDESGPEFAYSYTAPTDRTVYLTLSAPTVDLDLAVVLNNSSGQCRSANTLLVKDVEASFEAVAGQTYYFVVDGYNGRAGPYTLTVDDNIAAPEDNTQLFNNRPVFNWEDDPEATSYLFQVSATPTFRSLVWNRSTTRSVFFPTTDLPKNRPLYWRAIPRRGSSRGEPTPTRLVWTASPPSVPSLAAPSSGVLLRTLTPRLDWRNVTLSTVDAFGRYQLQLALDPTFLTPLVDVDLTDWYGSEYTLPEALASNTRYYWRVRAFDHDGQYSNWSAVRSFRTVLAAPQLSSPANGIITTGLRPVFEWASTDTPGSYTLQVSAYQNFRSTAVNKTLAGSAFQPAGNLRSGRQYFWRVRANGPNGPSAWSALGMFYTP